MDNIKRERERHAYRAETKKKKKRVGQVKVHSHQETVVYFPESNESANRGQWKFWGVARLTDTDPAIG